jgi:hypothetical protein
MIGSPARDGSEAIGHRRQNFDPLLGLGGDGARGRSSAVSPRPVCPIEPPLGRSSQAHSLTGSDRSSLPKLDERDRCRLRDRPN